MPDVPQSRQSDVMARKEDWIDRLRHIVRRANLRVQGFGPGDCTCRWRMTAEGGYWERHKRDPGCAVHGERLGIPDCCDGSGTVTFRLEPLESLRSMACSGCPNCHAEQR